MKTYHDTVPGTVHDVWNIIKVKEVTGTVLYRVVARWRETTSGTRTAPKKTAGKSCL